MNLPNAHEARVDQAKVVDYLLSPDHPDGRSKAAFFLGFGFDDAKWEALAAALRAHGANHEVTDTKASDHGALYCVDGRLTTPDGRNPLARTVWLIEKTSSAPRLITAYPLRRDHV